MLEEAVLEVSLLALTLVLIISDLTVSADMELSAVLETRLTNVGRPFKLLTNINVKIFGDTCHFSSLLCWTLDLRGLFYCSSWNDWCWVSQELWQFGPASMCMYTYAHTHTPTRIYVKTPVETSFCSLHADQFRLYVGLCLSWWPGVRWSRRLHQWDQLSMCA